MKIALLLGRFLKNDFGKMLFFCLPLGYAVHRKKDAVYPSFSGKIDACGMMQLVQGKQKLNGK